MATDHGPNLYAGFCHGCGFSYQECTCPEGPELGANCMSVRPLYEDLVRIAGKYRDVADLSDEAPTQRVLRHAAAVLNALAERERHMEAYRVEMDSQPYDGSDDVSDDLRTEIAIADAALRSLLTGGDDGK